MQTSEAPALLTSNTIFGPGATKADPAIINAATSPFVWLVNTRVALADIDLGDTRAEVAVWSRNLLNNREIVQYVGLSLVGSVIYEQARTFGVDVRFDFGPGSAPEAAAAAYVPPPVMAPAQTPKSYLVFFDFNKSDPGPAGGFDREPSRRQCRPGEGHAADGDGSHRYGGFRRL